MNLKRLNHLIRYMKKLSPEATEHFDMQLWINHPKALKDNFTRKNLMSCGTTACALGWAASLPSFKKAGLKLNAQARGYTNLAHAEVFFGLNKREAMALFAMYNVRSPAEWARVAEEKIAYWNRGGRDDPLPRA